MTRRRSTRKCSSREHRESQDPILSLDLRYQDDEEINYTMFCRGVRR